jgi:hypothetical protein
VVEFEDNRVTLTAIDARTALQNFVKALGILVPKPSFGGGITRHVSGLVV